MIAKPAAVAGTQLLRKVLQSLVASNYLDTQIGLKPNILHISLLPNGIKYAQHLQQHWEGAQSNNMPSVFQNHSHITYEPTESPLAFVHSSEFRKTFSDLSATAKLPLISKQLLSLAAPQEQQDKGAEKDLQIITKSGSCLITDYLLPPSSGLERFYNTQRERKIWWMRFAANPTRFTLEPRLLTDLNGADPSFSAINIKARFPWGQALIEHLTLIPLANARLQKAEQFHVGADRTLPAVIRSVIQLETAASVMLWDAADNDRDALLLNTKLAPHQIQLCCEESCAEQQELSEHIGHKLRACNLRVLADVETASSSCQKADHLGVPYTIIVGAESLRTGLLKLRARDTTLSETIHISDLTTYIPKIYSN